MMIRWQRSVYRKNEQRKGKGGREGKKHIIDEIKIEYGTEGSASERGEINL